MTTKLDNLIQACGAEDFESRKAAAQLRIRDVLVTIFDEIPELNLIVAKGYTPGFCDGDPCYRSFSVAVDAYDPEETMIELWENVNYGEDIDLDDEQQRHLDLMTQKKEIEKSVYLNGEFQPNPALTESNRNMIKAQKILDAMDSDFEQGFGDNQVTEITRQQNGFHINSEDYDCGH